MNTSINLLVIEDKPADFRLIVRHLERHGLAARCHCVASLEELEAAVEQGGWDAVLPDYSVPKLDFQHTLGLLQSRYPDLPLILVSGSVGEERAVELLKLGVWDFVLKDNLTRLIPAIERSLREATDRRERKQAEAALRESEKQFRAMFEVASIGMAQADPQTGQWLRVNQKMCAITGYSADEMVRMHISEITHPEDRQKDRDVFQRVIRGEIPDYRLEKRYLRKDGTIAWVNVNVTVIRDVVGQATHLLAAIEDITERKQREEALVLAKDAAEAANRAKSEFLNNMSHELRTPLTAILGCSELLSTGNLSPAVQGEFLEMIQRSGQGLLGIINDVLDLARIEADRLPLEKTDCALRQILDDVMAMAKITAAKKGLSLQVVHGLPLPATLYTDATRLRQILINLVGNAVKFTERGEVRLTVRCSESSRGTAQLQFAVSDTGIGIPSVMLDEIFRPFV
ncbi:MAG: PAS domain S-box protein, partial [Planctomycetota bacterium]|nr:PAS domain S-box protein [Planctomycetota bacterium]